MSIAAVAALVKSLRQYALLEPAQLDLVRGELQAGFDDPEALAGELVRRGWLTRYQAGMLTQGRGAELVLGSYVLLEPLGEGGMGQVFKARQRKLGRIDAVKVVRAERVADPEALKRFRREMTAAATLSHPNVVHTYYADEDGGRQYFAMELLAGTDLDEIVQRKGPLPFGEACDYVRQAALGLQHAHGRGMVHRDVKPQNLLLTQSGVIKVLDLGLARVERPPDCNDPTLTATGAMMGTPDYIAPEQTQQSHRVDGRADLYSLGGVLYFLLTGRPPFADRPLAAKIAGHLFDEPEPVERLRPGTPPAVVAVVRRLLAKKPEDRFQSAGELAAVMVGVGKELVQVSEAATGNWSGASTPQALAALTAPAAPLPAPAADPPRRSAPRRAILIAALGIVFVVAAGGVVGALGFGPWRSAPPAPPAPAATGTLVFESEDPLVRLVARRKDRPDDIHEAGPGETVALAEGDYALELSADTAAGLRLSAREASVSAGGRAAVRVEGLPLSSGALVSRPAALDGVQSWTIAPRGGLGAVFHLAYSPDGRWLAVGQEDDVVRLLTPAGEFVRAFVLPGGRVRALAWSPDKTDPKIAAADDGTAVRVWSAATGRLVCSASVSASALAWSADGKTLACAVDTEVRLLDAQSGQLARPPLAQANAVRVLAWSPDGAVLAAAGDEGAVHLWRPPDWIEEVRKGHTAPVAALAWSPDSSTLVSAGRDGSFRRWPEARGAPAPPSIATGKTALTAAAWVVEKTGPLLVTSGEGGNPDGSIQMWNPVTGELVRSLGPGGREMIAFAASPDHKSLVAGGYDRDVHVWDLKSHTEKNMILGHVGNLGATAAWSPDGKVIATNGWSNTIELWLTGSGELWRRAPRTPPDRTTGTSWASNRRLAYVCGDQVYVWNPVNGAHPTLPQQTSPPRLTAWAPMTHQLAVAYDDRHVRIWSVNEGVIVNNLEAGKAAIAALAWSPDGQLLAAGDDDGAIFIWEAMGGKKSREWKHPGKILGLAWSPDGKSLAASGGDGTVTLWDYVGGKLRRSLGDPRSSAGPVAWVSDGKTLLVLGEDHVERTWDVETGEPRGKVRGGSRTAAISPDGALLAAPAPSYTLRLWETATGRPLGTVLRLEPGWLVVSEDGNYHAENAAVEAEMVFVVQTADGQETLAPKDFAEKYQWHNDPDKAKLDTR